MLWTENKTPKKLHLNFDGSKNGKCSTKFHLSLEVCETFCEHTEKTKHVKVFKQTFLKELMPAVSELIIHLLMVPGSSITMTAFSSLIAKRLVMCIFRRCSLHGAQ